ncbi:MAG: lipopolysaccharide biosynthesis protein [bacterium]
MVKKIVRRMLKTRGFIENTSIYMFSTIFSFAVSIFVLPIYTRYLSPSDFGIVVLFIMFGNVSTGFLSVSLHFASYRYYFKYKQELNRYKTLNSTNMFFLLFVFLLSGIVVYHFSAWFSSKLFDDQLTKKLILWSYLSGCLEYLILYMMTLLTAQVHSIPHSLISILRIILNTAFSLYFIFVHSLTYMARIFAIFLAQGITLLCLIPLTFNLFEFRFSLSSLKESLKLSGPLLPQSLIGVIYGAFDKTMLNKLTGTNSVGFYSFGEKFSLILKAATDAVDRVWNAYFMNWAHEDSESAKQSIVNNFYEIGFFLC